MDGLSANLGKMVTGLLLAAVAAGAVLTLLIVWLAHHLSIHIHWIN